MKRNSTNNCKYFLKRITLAIALSVIFCHFATAQDQSQPQGKSEATIELSYYKKADMTKTAVAIVKARIDKKFVPAKNAPVNFYVLHNNEQQLLSSVNTDNKGKAVIALQNGLPLDKDRSFTIVAKIENDSLYEDTEEKMHYKEASLTLNLNPHDTARLVTAKVTEIGKDGKEIPVKDAELKFYVQRLFGIMPAAEDNTITTDEKGEASFAFPKNIPGDTAGVITVVARMEDNDQFGNVEKSATTFWGIPLAIEKNSSQRALWEPHAPLPLIFIIATIFGGVWCTYFFIIFQLRKIKEGDDNV
ncbi:MAG: Ig-like domain-containing protein [Bacteroidetes bacterium]|nr:Ig-like domain-containing protein [Bacteroidota bacterium]MCL6102602.1 Ig-like domain-containing protein [Bacteroidota bacterium]